MRRVKFLICKNILQIFNIVFLFIQRSHNWNDLIFMVENCSHETKFILVHQERVCNGIYKLNTDGSALNNSGKIGGGGILRDHQGKLVYAFVVPLDIGTNNQAETQQVIHGVNWCMQHRYMKIILEVDSKLFMKWITANSIPPWQLHNFIKKLQQITTSLEYFQCKTFIQRGQLLF